MAKLVVSACLLGTACRYDGCSKPSPVTQQAVRAWQEGGGQVVAVCPEQLGGLPTPRPAAELRGGDGDAVLNGQARVCRVEDGGDVTHAFVQGARSAAVQAEGAGFAILKARSPSCGVGQTQVDGALQPGDGVLAALLRGTGVVLCTDEDADGIAHLVPG